MSMLLHITLAVALLLSLAADGFAPPPRLARGSTLPSSPLEDAAALSGEDREEAVDWSRVTDEWELDCYSRPVLVDGRKKLWEVLVTDSSGSFRARRALPSNRVNSREVRRAFEEIAEGAGAKPSVVRFFRGSMFNMISIALGEVDVVAKPSRCTFALAQWIEERNRDVYPRMRG